MKSREPSNLLGRLSAKVEQLSADIEHLSADIEQLSAEVEKMSAGLEQLSAKVEQLSAKVEQLSAKVEQLSAVAKLLINSSKLRSTAGEQSPFVVGQFSPVGLFEQFLFEQVTASAMAWRSCSKERSFCSTQICFPNPTSLFNLFHSSVDKTDRKNF